MTFDIDKVLLGNLKIIRFYYINNDKTKKRFLKTAGISRETKLINISKLVARNAGQIINNLFAIPQRELFYIWVCKLLE